MDTNFPKAGSDSLSIHRVNSSFLTVLLNRSNQNQWGADPQSQLESTSDGVVPPYNQSDISRLCWARPDELVHLLLFDGKEFKVFGMYKNPHYCRCHDHFVALVIDGLLTARSERFMPNSPPFQVLLFTMLDSIYYKCVDDSAAGCSKSNFPPLLTPTSVPKTNDSRIASFIKQLPTGDYNKCLYKWRHQEKEKCLLEQKVQYDSTLQTWDKLQPQLYWRGSDIGFRIHRNLKQCSYVLPRKNGNCGLSTRQAADILMRDPNIQPRCRAVAMTLDAEAHPPSSSLHPPDDNNSTTGNNPWINVKFAENGRAPNWTNCGHSLYAPPTASSSMAKYKYQIDFAGIGGTTWLGTITKLAMPGLLFHHDSPSKDWFHDYIKPWEHYVPVNMDLSNLHEMFRWAEAHPLQAKQIAKRAQDFAREQVTNHTYQATFDKLYVHGLGQIVDAYRPAPNETLLSILQGYQGDGLHVTLLGTCDATGCKVKPEYFQ